MLFVDPKHPARAMMPENLGLRNLAFKVDQLESSMKELKAIMAAAGFEIKYRQPMGLHE